MLTSVKLALAGSALLAVALPAAAQAQGYYVDAGYGYDRGYVYQSDYGRGYDGRAYGYTYGEPYRWGSEPFWPLDAAAGIFGAAANVIASPFVGWRSGYWVDDRIDPVRYSYGSGAYSVPTYGDVPVVATSYRRPGYWGGYVATYRGKAHKGAVMHHAAARPAKDTKATRHMAAR